MRRGNSARVRGDVVEGIGSWLLIEQREVSIPGDSGCAQIVADDEHRDRSVLRDNHGPDDAGFGEDHVVALGADVSGEGSIWWSGAGGCC